MDVLNLCLNSTGRDNPSAPKPLLVIAGACDMLLVIVVIYFPRLRFITRTQWQTIRALECRLEQIEGG